MTATPELLFVYGTLRSGSDHPLAALLAEHGERLGRGTVRGLLLDVGPFPAFADARDETPVDVRGEVWALPAQKAHVVLEVLDAYEDATPAPGRNPLYVRCRRPVRTEDGREAEAWIYRWTGPVGEHPRIPSGDWLGRG